VIRLLFPADRAGISRVVGPFQVLLSCRCAVAFAAVAAIVATSLAVNDYIVVFSKTVAAKQRPCYAFVTTFDLREGIVSLGVAWR